MDGIMVSWSTVDLHHGLLCFLDFAMAVLITRGLGEEEDSDCEDDRPDECYAHWNPPGCSLVTLMLVGAEVDAGGQENTESDEELVRRDQGATNMARSGFGHIHWHKKRESTDSEARDKASHHDLIPFMFRGDHCYVANAENDVPEDKRIFSANEIGNRGS